MRSKQGSSKDNHPLSSTHFGNSLVLGLYPKQRDRHPSVLLTSGTPNSFGCTLNKNFNTYWKIVSPNPLVLKVTLPTKFREFPLWNVELSFFKGY